MKNVFMGDSKLNSLSKKIYLQLENPSEDNTLGDRDKVINILKDKYTNVVMSYEAMKKLYPMCRDNDFKITVTMLKREYDWIITNIESGDTTNNHYGLAVDLGSTTIIMQLVNLNNGEVIAEESIFNKQIKYGEDILTRIFYTKEKKNGLEEICKSTVESFIDLLNKIKEKTHINVYDSSMMIVSGNTTMTHFLLGINPWTIFQSPFTPVFNESGFIKGKEIGIPIKGYVYCFPSVANYFGGDLVSGLLYTEIYKKNEISALIDIGTNVELVIGNNEFLVAAAGAAGPALEGGISKF